MQVAMTARHADGSEWRSMGSVTEGQHPGSISSETLDGKREIFMFGWYEGDPGVWLSSSGVDMETSDMRQIISMGIEKLSDLSEPFEMLVNTAKTKDIVIRFELQQQ